MTDRTVRFQIFRIVQALFLCFSASTHAKTADYEALLQELELPRIELVDLCSGKPASPNWKKIQHVEIWSEHCGNCLWFIEDHKYDQNLVLVHVGEDARAACEWLAKKKVNVPSYSDRNRSIEKFMKGELPLPANLRLSDGSIREAKIGYWRSTAKPE
jgi:hypothetical protein